MSLEETRTIWLHCDQRDEPMPGKMRGLRCYRTIGTGEYGPDDLHELADDARKAGWAVTETIGPEPTWTVTESLCPEHRDTAGGGE